MAERRSYAVAIQRAMLRCYGVDGPEPDPDLVHVAALAALVTGAPVAAVEAELGGTGWAKAWSGAVPDVVPPVRYRVPVRDPDGVHLGALVVRDDRPGTEPGHEAVLAELAAQAGDLLRLRWSGGVEGGDVPGVAVLDADGVLRAATPALERLLGWSVAERVGTNVLGLVHPDDAADALESFANTLEFSGEKLPIDVRLATAGGGHLPVELVADNRLDDPTVGAVVLTVRDIRVRGRTDSRVAAEVRLLGMMAAGAPYAQTLARIAELVDDAVDATRCCVFLVDPDGTTLRPVAAPNLPAELVAATDGTPVRADGAPWGAAAAAGVGLVTTDLPTDPAWAGHRDPWLAAGVRAWWSMPIRGNGNSSVLGIFGLFRSEPGRPRAEHSRLLDLCAGLAAVAIERGRAEVELAHAASHDDLTGLPNRKAFCERLAQALAGRRREDGGLAVLFVDLDHFKLVNDSHGHALGDRLLRAVADRLRALSREGDVVARFGGDEFTLLCRSLAGPGEALAVAERLVAGLAEPLRFEEAETYVRASIGVALANGDDHAEALLRDADAAMYRAKERGRNRVEVFDGALRARVLQRRDVEQALHHALRRGELEVHYQPEWTPDGAEVVGVEALVRWRHARRGLLLPAAFVPVAEESGLVVLLDEHVLRQACSQATAWRRAGLGPVVWANLAAQSLADPHLVERVARVLADAGAEPDWVGLELTESSLMTDADASVAALRALKDLGVHLAIDDFGTGYSSLGYLKRLPADVVKVDQTFVEGLGQGNGDDAIVAAVVGLSHALGLQALAEGVERPEQLAAVAELGCDAAQGYLLGAPTPAPELAELLGRHAGGAR